MGILFRIAWKQQGYVAGHEYPVLLIGIGGKTGIQNTGEAELSPDLLIASVIIVGSGAGGERRTLSKIIIDYSWEV